MLFYLLQLDFSWGWRSACRPWPVQSTCSSQITYCLLEYIRVSIINNFWVRNLIITDGILMVYRKGIIWSIIKIIQISWWWEVARGCLMISSRNLIDTPIAILEMPHSLSTRGLSHSSSAVDSVIALSFAI